MTHLDWIAGSLFLFAAAPAGLAQASFVESFDTLTATSGTGPDNLVAAGWVFRNQSEPVGETDWYDGWLFSPYAGSGYLAVDESSTGFFGGDISTWAILPPIPGQLAGDLLSFQIQGSVVPVDRFEVRYSPSGGTSTGTSAADVGDFTDLLLDVPLQNGGWSPVSVALPGPGAIALRYVADNTCNFTCGASSLGIDELSVGAPPPPACNQPTLPLAGQTVTWDRLGGPWVVCSDLLIPFASKVVVEAGAQVLVDPGVTLTVNGEIEFQGTATDPVTFQGATAPFGTHPIRIVGTATVTHAQVEGLLYCAHGGTLLVSDSTFSNAGVWTQDSIGGPDHDTFVRLVRSTVSGADVYVQDGTLVASEVSITGAGIGISRGYAHLSDIDVDGGPVSLYRQDWAQPGYLNDLTVTNSPTGGLVLDGSDFWVGPDNVLAGNQAPVRLTGGLLTGSTIPTSGNLNDHIDVLDGATGGGATWGKQAVPYVIDGVGVGGSLRIDAGAEVLFKADAGLLFQTGVRAVGSAADPIRFAPYQTGQKWQLMKFQSAVGTIHFEHCEFRESERALQSDNSIVFADSCLFQGNDAGVWTNTFGILVGRSCRFVANGIGAHLESGQINLDGSTNPNSFGGNGIAIDGGTSSARSNWWGAASGPTHPSNPGGTGDPVAGSVPVLPFLTSPPDYADAPPQVTLRAGPGLLLEGQRTIVTWSVAEDSAVASQRVLYSQVGNVNFTTIATLDGASRAFEFTAPKGPTGSQGYSFLRVVAVDDAGQEGWDEVNFSTPYVDDVPGGEPTFTILTDLSAGFVMGDDFQVDYLYSGTPVGLEADIVLDSEGVTIAQGGFPSSLGSWDFFDAPYVSTDQARVCFTVQHGNNRFYKYYSEPFSVRPHALVPDAPPQVTLHAPAAGRTFAGGGAVALSWTGSDDEAVREFRVQASFHGATWVTLATLDGSASQWTWELPPSAGHERVELRVVAVDERFQNSSATTWIEIAPGPDERRLPSFGGIQSK